MAKGIKTGGRVKGSKNKRRSAEAIADELGFDPLRVIAMVAMGDWKGLGYESECFVSQKGEGDGKSYVLRYVITPEMRLDAAKHFSKFIYAQKQAVALSSEGSGVEIVVRDYTKGPTSAT
jgi:hypothetical protein